MVSPDADACALEIPNWLGETVSPAWTSADIACAAIGMTAPASSTAPRRAGRHSAAAAATRTSATMTATFPAITGPGLAKAFPAVSECTTPDGVRKT